MLCISKFKGFIDFCEDFYNFFRKRIGNLNEIDEIEYTHICGDYQILITTKVALEANKIFSKKVIKPHFSISRVPHWNPQPKKNT